MSARPRNLGPLAGMRAEGLPPQYVHHPLRRARGLRVGCRARGARRPLFRRSQFYAIAALTSRSLRRHPPGPSEGIVVIRRVALRGVAAGGSNMGGRSERRTAAAACGAGREMLRFAALLCRLSIAYLMSVLGQTGHWSRLRRASDFDPTRTSAETRSEPG